MEREDLHRIEKMLIENEHPDDLLDALLPYVRLSTCPCPQRAPALPPGTDGEGAGMAVRAPGRRLDTRDQSGMSPANRRAVDSKARLGADTSRWATVASEIVSTGAPLRMGIALTPDVGSSTHEGTIATASP
jgi:hypothetical protein